jgi:hypothetical protein
MSAIAYRYRPTAEEEQVPRITVRELIEQLTNLPPECNELPVMLAWSAGETDEFSLERYEGMNGVIDPSDDAIMLEAD